jgi:hypothetical protein
VKREFHARFIEKLGVKLPLLTRRSENKSRKKTTFVFLLLDCYSEIM